MNENKKHNLAALALLGILLLFAGGGYGIYYFSQPKKSAFELEVEREVRENEWKHLWSGDGFKALQSGGSEKKDK